MVEEIERRGDAFFGGGIPTGGCGSAECGWWGCVATGMGGEVM